MRRTLQEWSHFEELKKEINTFAKNEKQKTLKNLLNLIATDYLGFGKQLEKDKDLVEGNLSSINNEILKVEQKRKDYNKLAQKADNLIKIDKINAEFDFIHKEIEAFNGLQSIEGVRNAITNLFESIQKKEKEVFSKIIKEFSDFFKEYDSKDLILESLDFGEMEIEASNFDKDKYIITPEKIKTHWSGPDERIKAVYNDDVIEEIKIRNFKALAMRKAKAQKDVFLPQVKKKADNMRNLIFDEIDEKNKDELCHLENLESQLSGKEKFIAEKVDLIAKSLAASEELKKLAQDYGYEI